MARIAIVGPGAIGGTVAGCLSRSRRHDVFLCARRVIPNLTIETAAGVSEIRPIVWTNPRDAEPVDWVLVATKAYDVEATAAWFPRLRGSRAPVAVLQNGVEHRERFAAHVPPAEIVPVVVRTSAERPEPTLIRQRTPVRLTVGTDGHGPAFCELFAGTGAEITPTADFRSAAWAKLCLNAAGVLSALVLRPAEVMHDEPIAEAARAIVRECIAVGRAEGAMLPDDLPETVVRSYRGQPPDSVNSLHADCLAHRPTEIDARNGVVVRLGRSQGIPTPCNELAVALLNARTRPSRT
ncbi:MAG: 2-dehydropantoate 2-reductase [Opitutaceae bacterium]